MEIIREVDRERGMDECRERSIEKHKPKRGKEGEREGEERERERERELDVSAKGERGRQR